MSIKVYEKVLSELKENFQEYTAEVVSITDKSIKLLTIFVSFVAASGGYILSINSNSIVNLFLGIAAIIVILSIYNVFKGHEVHYSGTIPDKVLTNDFDNPDFKEDQERLIYKNLIEQYIYKIRDMEQLNSERVKRYDNCLLYAISITVAISFYIGLI